MGPLHDPVTWYGINYAGTQVTQCDFQNKGKSGWTGTSSFVLEVLLCNLRPSIINSVTGSCKGPIACEDIKKDFLFLKWKILPKLKRFCRLRSITLAGKRRKNKR